MPETPRVPSWLCNGDFNDAMCSSFDTFYGQCLDSGTSDAIIYVNSSGGSIATLDHILTIIETSPIHFHTVATGVAASCGLLLVGGGTTRYAAPRANLMFHEPAMIAGGDCEQIMEDAKRMGAWSTRLMTAFAKRTKHPRKWWTDQSKKSENRYFWISAKQALKYGAVDYLGVPIERRAAVIQVSRG